VLRGTNGGDNTFAGIIPDAIGADALSLYKLDAGKWILSGVNTYEGATFVQGGTLEVTNLANGGIGSSIGAASNAAANLSLNNGTTLRYTGSGHSTDRAFTINGTAAGHSVTLDASGTGAANFTNTASLNYGAIDQTRTLIIRGNSTSLNTLAANVTDNGTGAVTVEKNDVGTWALTGMNSSYTGPTRIFNGTLEVSKLADGGVNSSIGASTNINTNLVIGNGATLRYVGSGDSTDRRFRFNGSLVGLTATLDASGTGAVNFTQTLSPDSSTTNQARTLVLRGTNTGDNTLAANLANNGTAFLSVNKLDPGKWILTGTNTYQGDTTIDGGTLLVNGSLAPASDVFVNVGGTVGGTGTIGGNVTGAGNIAPGASPGAITIGGDFDLSGTYLWELGAHVDDANGVAGVDWDLVNAGTADLTDLTLDLNFILAATDPDSGDPFWDSDHTWLVVNASDSLTGNFSAITLGGSAFAFDTGTFETFTVGNQAFLQFSSTVPEPSAIALWSFIAVGLIGGAMFQARRRRMQLAPLFSHQPDGHKSSR
jgi:fibronectin-binding autotransporter adhesin